MNLISARKNLNQFIRSGVLAGILPTLFWIICTWPGYMNADSALHWKEAASNNYSNWFPVTYSLLLKVSQLLGTGTALLVVLQCAATLFAVTFATSTLTESRVARNVTVFIVMAWPQTGGTMVLVAKDALFAASFVIVVTCLVRLERNKLDMVRPITALLIFAATLMVVLRWNGPIIILGLGLIVGIRRRPRFKLVLGTLGLSLCIGLVVLLKPPFSDNSGGTGLRISGQAIDIAWALRADPNSFSDDQLSVIDSIAPRELWIESQRNCNNSAMPLLDGVFNEVDGAGSRLSLRRSELRDMWVEQLLTNADVFVKGRLCRVKGLVVPARDWWPVSSQPSQIVFPSRLGLSAPATLTERGLRWTSAKMDLWGGSTLGIVLSMPFVWMIMGIVVNWILRRKQSRSHLVLVASFVVPSSVFISGAGLEPRYVWPATLLFIIDFSIHAGTNREPLPNSSNPSHHY